MAATYEPIATTTLGSNAATVTFSNIPGTYTDLVFVINASQAHTGATSVLFRFNSDTGSNYSYTRIYADGSVALSDRGSNLYAAGIGIIGNQAITSAGTFIANIQNYSNSTTYKTTISRSSDSSGGYVASYVSLWRNTNPITSIDIKFGNFSGSFFDARSGSTFTLYGIKAA